MIHISRPLNSGGVYVCPTRHVMIRCITSAVDPPYSFAMLTQILQPQNSSTLVSSPSSLSYRYSPPWRKLFIWHNLVWNEKLSTLSLRSRCKTILIAIKPCPLLRSCFHSQKVRAWFLSTTHIWYPTQSVEYPYFGCFWWILRSPLESSNCNFVVKRPRTAQGTRSEYLEPLHTSNYCGFSPQQAKKSIQPSLDEIEGEVVVGLRRMSPKSDSFDRQCKYRASPTRFMRSTEPSDSAQCTTIATINKSPHAFLCDILTD